MTRSKVLLHSIVAFAALAATHAGAATPPFVQVTAALTQLADSCVPQSTGPRILVNLDVPADALYSYTVSYLTENVSYRYPDGTSIESVYTPLYESGLRAGPVANSAAPFYVGTPSDWYAEAPPDSDYWPGRLPDNTRLTVTFFTYKPNQDPEPSSVANVTSSASFTWNCTTGQITASSNTGNSSGVAPVMAKATAIEFYSDALDHYFVTASAAEAAALDSGQIAGWRRTGQAFGVFAAPADGATPVCRYYIPPGSGDSHFYSASPAECQAVAAGFPTLTLESSAVFYAVLPDRSTGECPPTMQPVYRLWNGRRDSNHRYTTDLALRAQMLVRGYKPEGYGADGVGMCAPL